MDRLRAAARVARERREGVCVCKCVSKGVCLCAQRLTAFERGNTHYTCDKQCSVIRATGAVGGGRAGSARRNVRRRRCDG